MLCTQRPVRFDYCNAAVNVINSLALFSAVSFTGRLGDGAVSQARGRGRGKVSAGDIDPFTRGATLLLLAESLTCCSPHIEQ